MCTVTFIPTATGIYPTSNRDERPGRRPARFPYRTTAEIGQLLFPRDGEAGGSAGLWSGLGPLPASTRRASWIFTGPSGWVHGRAGRASISRRPSQRSASRPFVWKAAGPYALYRFTDGAANQGEGQRVNKAPSGLKDAGKSNAGLRRKWASFIIVFPGSRKGIFPALSVRKMLTVKGDGRSTVEALLLKNERYVLPLPALRAIYGDLLQQTPAAEEERLLVPYGNHSRGAQFLDWSDKLNRLSGSACLISFCGTLPIGTLNISIANLVINRNCRGAVLFGLGAILAGMIMVRIALSAVKRLERMTPLLQWFRVFTCGVILLLSFISLQPAWGRQSAAMALPFTGHAPFVSGLVLSLLNPLHLPFWMGWTAVLRSRGQLSDTGGDYTIYVLAIGIGTGLAFMAYGVVGHLLILFLRMNQYLFNWMTGIALLFVGLVQLWKLIIVRG